MVKRKPRTGRKKIEIKRIDDAAARDVCFSKRRQGLFNKAGELSLLCDANIAIVVFSRTRKGFSFGHPSVDDVANRLASMTMGIADNPSVGGGSHDSGEMDRRHWRRRRVENETLEKEMGGHLIQTVNSEANLLGLDEVEELHYKLSVVHADISARRYQKLQDPKEARLTLPQPQPHMEMTRPSQFLHEEQTVVPTNAHLPGSNYGLIVEIDASCMLSSVQGGGGSRGSQNRQFGG
uniref:MADS-box domain-containing protein n=1 Tax=Leersia perrieri TaxID=77586 RepID=A0A0D9WET4_9ORYZ